MKHFTLNEKINCVKATMEMEGLTVTAEGIKNMHLISEGKTTYEKVLHDVINRYQQVK